MTATNITRSEATPDWHLMAEFAVKNLLQAKRSLRNQIVEAIKVLNISPALLERIHEVTIQAINSLERSAKLGDRLPVVRIRILSSAAKAEGGGWGFFLVVKSGSESPQNTVEASYLVDMFLYQEHGPDIEGC
jgi:hypothetical protein